MTYPLSREHDESALDIQILTDWCRRTYKFDVFGVARFYVNYPNSAWCVVHSVSGSSALEKGPVFSDTPLDAIRQYVNHRTRRGSEALKAQCAVTQALTDAAAAFEELVASLKKPA